MNTQKLILIRGLPGSGKSTLAKQLQGFKHYEADMFHMKDGVYCFDPAKVREAHSWCQQKTKEALEAEENVVVSNTFTRKWELEPYLTMAHTFGISVQIITVKGNFGNIHGVPEEVIADMKKRWEEV